MVETLKVFLGITNNTYDFIIVTFVLVLFIFCFKYSADLLAYLMKFAGGRR